MNWHRRLAAFFVLLALAACAQEGQVLYAPYSPENMQGSCLYRGATLPPKILWESARA
jgi:hypothetical protein